MAYPFLGFTMLFFAGALSVLLIFSEGTSFLGFFFFPSYFIISLVFFGIVMLSIKKNNKLILFGSLFLVLSMIMFGIGMEPIGSILLNQEDTTGYVAFESDEEFSNQEASDKLIQWIGFIATSGGIGSIFGILLIILGLLKEDPSRLRNL